MPIARRNTTDRVEDEMLCYMQKHDVIFWGGGETVEKSKKKSLGLGGIFRKRPKMAPGQVDNDFWRRGRFWTKMDDFG
jgi:hypothetical protein